MNRWVILERGVVTMTAPTSGGPGWLRVPAGQPMPPIGARLVLGSSPPRVHWLDGAVERSSTLETR